MKVPAHVAREYEELVAGIVRDFNVLDSDARAILSRSARWLGTQDEELKKARKTIASLRAKLSRLGGSP